MHVLRFVLVEQLAMVLCADSFRSKMNRVAKLAARSDVLQVGLRKGWQLVVLFILIKLELL